MARIEFPESVKLKLAQRVGYSCSFPGCPVQTIGPSAERSDKVSSSGTACHIIPASAGSKAMRYDPDYPKDKIGTYENGIWCCATHGRLIDTDETTYTAELLRYWRQVAEYKAHLQQEHGQNIQLKDFYRGSHPFPKDEYLFNNLGHENEIIGDAILHNCIHELWGDDLGHAIRDLIIELVRNALTHGGASECWLNLSKQSISLTDNGSRFDIADMGQAQRQSGGFTALEHMKNQWSNELIIGYHWLDSRNHTLLSRIYVPSDVSNTTQCFVEPTFWPVKFKVTSVGSCNPIYIIGREYISYSDISHMRVEMTSEQNRKRNFVYVARGISDGVIKEIESEIPNCAVMRLK